MPLQTIKINFYTFKQPMCFDDVFCLCCTSIIKLTINLFILISQCHLLTDPGEIWNEPANNFMARSYVITENCLRSSYVSLLVDHYTEVSLYGIQYTEQYSVSWLHQECIHAISCIFTFLVYLISRSGGGIDIIQ